MNPARPRRRAVVVLGLAVTLTGALSACGSDPVQFGTAQPVGATATDGAAGAGAASPAAAGAPSGTGVLISGNIDEETATRIAGSFPAFPPVVIPDVTALTGASKKFTSALARLTTPTSGVSVSGARCDTTGKVVNRGSLTEVNNGDGSGTFQDGSLQVTNSGDGSGVYRNGALQITVAADGSGALSDGSLQIAIESDGSGVYSDGAFEITLDGKGAGTLSDGSLQIAVAGDGSGTYSDGSLQEVNNGDGTGTFTDGALHVINKGDGTATFEDGADSGVVRMAPLPPVPDLGTFPPVRSLTPVGKACGTLIRLNSEVLFDFDKATLRPGADKIMDQLAGALKGVTSKIRIEGHTDAKGEDAYNQDLSERRSQAVVAALKQRSVSGVLVAAGFGEARPIAPNTKNGKDYPAGRQLNRRVEIVIPAGS